ncbi:ATP-dependent helicase [Mycobacterium intracellulare]|uniref:3'-5' exonuclease n=1 Tax=Mycobacterium intracellulare TaxID=1767 RepID=UPI001CDAB334|nr:3'-5' exonuclease [Mycobacterium intracellulare]MCA2253870.1 ATP-dependent helicase [Mycobacterium intracellulare]
MSPLPRLEGQQAKVVFLSSNEHHVVLGTAGTGKSTMAMVRALHLARKETANNGRVLVVTFNNTLVAHLRYLASGQTSDQLTVENYHTFARGYLGSMGRMSWNGIIQTDEEVVSLVADAVAAVRAAVGDQPVLTRSVTWFADEIHWLSGMNITTEAAYQEADRVGRTTALQSGLSRAIVWSVRERYHALRAKRGYTNDWHDLGSTVIDALATDTRARRYRHIIIDEGQDLSPAEIRSLVNAVQPGGSLTFFGDYHQAIYGHGLSWKSAGIDIAGRPVERFYDNYRNTAQIARVAIAMANSEYMKSGDKDLLVEPQQPTAAGPQPTLVRCKSLENEIAMVKTLAGEASKDQKVAILARARHLAKRAANGLKFTELKKDMAIWDDEPGLYVGSYHSAKGLEFDAVFLPFLSDDVLPNYYVLQEHPPDEAFAREARTLYVSITRARSSLVMSYTGTLTPLLPPNDGLWTEESK